MPKAYSYLRFSTPEQSKGDSFRRQTQMAEQYIRRHPELKLELDTHLTLHDLGVSAYKGKNVETGALGKFKEAVDAGLVEPGSFLLVESLDRISRQAARQALYVLGGICDEGITVVTLADGQEYTKHALDSDPTKLLMSLLIFIRANEESQTKARRIRAAWEGKRLEATTKKLTARGPSWLTLDKEKGRFVVVQERARIIRRIFKDTLKGIGKVVIARRLNEERVPVFGSGERWHPSFISKLLESPSVTGVYVPHTESQDKNGKRVRKPLKPIPDYYPQIIDEETYERVQSMSEPPRSGSRKRHVALMGTRNLFGNLLRCGRCGAAVTRVNKGEGSKGGTYLVCTAAKVGAGCQYEAVRYDAIESSFLDDAGWILAETPAGTRGEDIDEELSKLDAQLQYQSEQIENLTRGLAVRFSAAVAAQIRDAEDERDKLEARRGELTKQQSELSGPFVARKRDDLLDALKVEPLDRQQANILLRQVFSNIVLDYDSGGYSLEWKHGGRTDAPARWRFPEKKRKPKRSK